MSGLMEVIRARQGEMNDRARNIGASKLFIHLGTWYTKNPKATVVELMEEGDRWLKKEHARTNEKWGRPDGV